MSFRKQDAESRNGNPPAPKRQQSAPDRDLQRLEEELADAIGAEVKVSANRKGIGNLTIRFASLDQLDGILGRLRGVST